jgi:2-polyprenyl-6-methoxyphenol hydroxylase-like FAD-dependent oxidoreductase
MSKTFDVCIQGDGVVGRTLALLLARERLRVALVTAPAPLPAGQDVRAYALNASSKKMLEALRVWPSADLATSVGAMRVWGDDGGVVDFDADFDAVSAGQGALAWIVDVPALEQNLLDACRFQSQIETTVEPAAAALSVICEGQKSSSRAVVAAQWSRKSYAQKAIAARLVSSVPHTGAARQWFTGGDILALLPMGGAGGNSMALVWSVADERADTICNLPPAEFCAAVMAVCGEQVGQLELTGEPATWPLALSKAEHWVGAGWALAGDAAHTVHPLAGQGLNLGLADAACLAGVLARREYWRALGDERLLRRYERARKAEVAAVSAVTDGLHGLFAQSGVPWKSLRNLGMNGVAASKPLKNWLTRRAAGMAV